MRREDNAAPIHVPSREPQQRGGGAQRRICRWTLLTWGDVAYSLAVGLVTGAVYGLGLFDGLFLRNEQPAILMLVAVAGWVGYRVGNKTLGR